MVQNRLNKLELTWVGKYDEKPALEPRILIENPEYSYGKVETGTLPNGRPWNGNMLIHGDNLLALKSLEQDYAGCIKCIYIDPPYNTGSAFEHYDDNLEHSIWLSLMRERLIILYSLLSKDGSIWVNLDDNEVFYCKILMDEIFGRQNFVGSIIWEKADSPKMDPKYFSTRHDTILVFAKEISSLKIYREIPEKIPEHYNKVDSNGRRYYLKPMRVMGGNVSESLFYPMIAPDGTEILPISSTGQKTCWRWSKNKVKEESDRIEWVNGRNGWSLYFRIYADSTKGIPVQTIWTHEEAGSNRTSKAEINALFGNNTFDTPKPEKLIKKVFAATTEQGDLVLDSFLGSGTTAAVAQKMGRRYIGIELGNHAYTHCYPRLKMVTDGTDQGGISKAQGWKGDGNGQARGIRLCARQRGLLETGTRCGEGLYLHHDAVSHGRGVGTVARAVGGRRIAVDLRHLVPARMPQPFCEHHPQKDSADAARPLRVRSQRLLPEHHRPAGDRS